MACPSCDWEEVVPCIVYKSGDVRQVEDLQANCSMCGDELNIEQWLVSVNNIIECHLLLLFFPHSPMELKVILKVRKYSPLLIIYSKCIIGGASTAIVRS